MIRSGLIFGAVSFLLTLASATLISPLCAPCLGLILGLGAGYVAGSFDKPSLLSDSIKKGAIAGAIAGGFGFIGGMIAGIINGAYLNPADMQGIYNLFGLPNTTITQGTIWLVQLVGAACLGLFNVAWMAVLGVAGGALWYQVAGKNQSGIITPPKEPEPPSL
jgi:hypothetical protein